MDEASSCEVLGVAFQYLMLVSGQWRVYKTWGANCAITDI